MERVGWKIDDSSLAFMWTARIQNQIEVMAREERTKIRAKRRAKFDEKGGIERQ